MTDPFASQAAPIATSPTAPAGDPFAAPGGVADPFAPLAAGGSFGPAPSVKNLEGRLTALRIRRLEDGQKFGAPVGVTEIRGVMDVAVLDGGMIYAPAAKVDGKVPFNAPMQECGEAPQVFKSRFVSNKGILNRFTVVTDRFPKLPEEIGTPVDFAGPNTVIMGRMGRWPGNKDVAKYLNLPETPDEDGLLLINQWLATKPTEEQVNAAGLFRTIVDVKPETRAVAVAWAQANKDFFA